MSKPKRPGPFGMPTLSEQDDWEQYADDMDRWLAEKVLPHLMRAHALEINRWTVGHTRQDLTYDDGCSTCRLIAELEAPQGRKG